MFSKEDLARIVKDEAENLIKKGKRPCGLYYILFNGKMYPQSKYDKEVAKGTRSPNNIYAYVDEWHTTDFDDFLFHIDYLAGSSVNDIVSAYLRRMGFTVEYYGVLSPASNLKYFIYAGIKRGKYRKLEYLVVNVYDVDALARTFHIPQIVEQKLGNKPRKITEDEFFDISGIVANEQPLLAGYAYFNAYDILYNYYVSHKKKKYKNEAYKIVLAYARQFPTPYRVCYEWKMEMFIEIDCLKLERLRFSS